MSVATQATESTPPKRFRPGVALVAFLVVLAVGLGFALIRSSDSDVAVTPTGIAESYIEARDTWDADAAIALFASDAVINDLGASPDEIPSHFAWFRAIGASISNEECSQTAIGYTTETWEVFLAWVNANHPDDRSVMTVGLQPSLTPEAIVLYEQYTNEFVAEQGGS